MTKTATEARTIWAVASGLTVPTSSDGGTVLYRGQWVTLTPEQIERTRDRFGNSWLDETEADQLRRYGEVRWAEGLPPEGIGVGLDDDAARAAQRAEAESNLKFIADPEERKAASDAIKAKFGRGNPSAQRSTRQA